MTEENGGGGAFFKAPRHPFPKYQNKFGTHTFYWILAWLAPHERPEEAEELDDGRPPGGHVEGLSSAGLFRLAVSDERGADGPVGPLRVLTRDLEQLPQLLELAGVHVLVPVVSGVQVVDGLVLW